MNQSKKLCIICSKESLYKCPKCKLNYCSINCYKEHKKNCESKNDNNNNNIISNKNRTELKLDEDDDIILSKQQLSKLKKNEKIMNIIKNKQIKAIIKEIDGTKYKKKLLRKFIDSDPEFKDFTCEIVRTLGFEKNGEFNIDK